MADYSDKKLDELQEIARERDLKGRSGLNKDELAEALAEDDASQESGDDAGQASEEENDRAEGSEYATVGKNSDASDPENEDVAENLSPEGQESLEKVGEDSEYAAESDLALDASGPLIFQDPEKRIMTGAVSEEHAKEQEEQLSKLPEGYVGDAPEVVSDEFAAAADADLNGGEPVQQEDVIDFPAPLAEREEAKAEQREGSRAAVNSDRGSGPDALKAQNIAETQDDEQALVAANRAFDQRAQLYTDGLGGGADHNLERSYRVQSLKSGISLAEESPSGDDSDDDDE